MQFLIWLESIGLSVWIRESPSLLAFPFILFLHTLGLALIAGISSALAFGFLGFTSLHPAGPIRQFFPAMWLGLAVNTISGLLLLIAYPAKALTNPVFYIKIVAIIAALAIVQQFQRTVELNPAAAESMRTKKIAVALLLLWLVAITTGRFLAYTHNMLMASEFNFF